MKFCFSLKKAFNSGIDYKSDSVGVGWCVGGCNGVSGESDESVGTMICYKGR